MTHIAQSVHDVAAGVNHVAHRVDEIIAGVNHVAYGVHHIVAGVDPRIEHTDDGVDRRGDVLEGRLGDLPARADGGKQLDRPGRGPVERISDPLDAVADHLENQVEGPHPVGVDQRHQQMPQADTDPADALPDRGYRGAGEPQQLSQERVEPLAARELVEMLQQAADRAGRRLGERDQRVQQQVRRLEALVENPQHGGLHRGDEFPECVLQADQAVHGRDKRLREDVPGFVPRNRRLRLAQRRHRGRDLADRRDGERPERGDAQPGRSEQRDDAGRAGDDRGDRGENPGPGGAADTCRARAADQAEQAAARSAAALRSASAQTQQALQSAQQAAAARAATQAPDELSADPRPQDPRLLQRRRLVNRDLYLRMQLAQRLGADGHLIHQQLRVVGARHPDPDTDNLHDGQVSLLPAAPLVSAAAPGPSRGPRNQSAAFRPRPEAHSGRRRRDRTGTGPASRLDRARW